MTKHARHGAPSRADILSLASCLNTQLHDSGTTGVVELSVCSKALVNACIRAWLGLQEGWISAMHHGTDTALNLIALQVTALQLYNTSHFRGLCVTYALSAT